MTLDCGLHSNMQKPLTLMLGSLGSPVKLNMKSRQEDRT